MERMLQIKNQGKTTQAACTQGERLFDVLKRAGIPIDAACGGKGTCGKCKVTVLSGEFGEISAAERRFLSDEECLRGVRLACFACVFEDGTVEVASKGRATIQTEGISQEIPLSPLFRRICVTLPKPSLDDQRSDAQRLADALDGTVAMEPAVLRALPDVLEAGDFRVTVVCRECRMIKLLPGDRSDRQYAVAVDIGTTTVVAYLIDLCKGDVMASVNALNAQKVFGADVIARIQHTLEQASGLEELSGAIGRQADGMIAKLAESAGICREDIDYAVFAGNTVMLHLLLGVSVRGIASAPFQPAFLEPVICSMRDCKLTSYDGAVILLPGISGYVGGDITAGVEAVCLVASEHPQLLVDIGTNGEMVLGWNGNMLACSTAAGPAFEGAHIRCGMGGADGAVSAFSFENGKSSYTTIGSKPPIGICGSGLLDLIAALLQAGLIEETGRILDEDEFPDEYREYACEVDGEPAFLVAKTQDESPIVLTQRDIRQVQLAKAAIAAGIRTLLSDAGITADAVECVYLAGGFGSYLNPQSAVDIGLLPREFRGKIKAAGNTAGMGAVLAAKSEDALARMRETARQIRYIELSSSADFQDFYMECMLFDPEG